MNVLIFNCGSSSQGFTVFQGEGNDEPKIPAFGKARNVATQTRQAASLEWTIDGKTERINADLSTHAKAAELILSILKQNDIPIDAIGHRFVNGGTFFQKAAFLDDQVMAQLRESLPLAPIHNPNSYSVIEVCRKELPGVPQYAVFDTAFHAGIPEENAVYAIPQADAKQNGWRKIGFHGLSYDYVSKRAAQLLGKPLNQVKLVMCHLGTGGSSVCAFRDGKSVDTSMGFSTFTGLVMSTRSGDIDPQIILDMADNGMTPEQISDYLCKKSGLLGLSAYSSNLGEIIEAAENGNKDCGLAFKVYVNRLRAYIGAFLYELNGADALIFTDDAGIKYAEMRQAVCANSDFFGLELDPAKNNAYDQQSEACLSTGNSRIQIWAIPTNEERTIYNEILGTIQEQI